MLNIGDYAVHKTTRNVGKVFGYGHQIVDGVYLPTLKVRVSTATGVNQESFVENLSSEWVLLEEEAPQEILPPTQFNRILRDAA